MVCLGLVNGYVGGVSDVNCWLHLDLFLMNTGDGLSLSLICARVADQGKLVRS